jgi:hypothetical protein
MFALPSSHVITDEQFDDTTVFIEYKNYTAALIW